MSTPTTEYAYESPSWSTEIRECQPGALALLDALGAFGVTHASCYADRQVPGSNGVPSTHREGRALDVGLATNGLDADAMTAIVDRLIDAAPALQVQQIIWSMRFWRVGLGWQPYDGAAGRHEDHAHVELTRHAAETLTLDACREALGIEPEPEPIPQPNPYESESAMIPVLYNDANYHNVFAIFPTGEVLHVSPELAQHYLDAGAKRVDAAHHGQTITGLFAKSGLDFSTEAVGV